MLGVTKFCNLLFSKIFSKFCWKLELWVLVMIHLSIKRAWNPTLKYGKSIEFNYSQKLSK